MRRTKIAAGVLAAATLLLAAGCGGSDGSSDGSGAPTDPATSASTSTSSSPSTSAPTVAAATGPLLDMPRASLHAPDTWRLRKKLVTFSVSAGDPQSVSLVQLGDLDATNDASLAVQAHNATRGYAGTPPKVLAPVTIDGVPCYHVAGQTTKLSYVEAFGAIHNDGMVSVQMTFSSEIKPAERQQLIDSMLASWKWK